MKSALAIVFILAFVWAQIVPGQSPETAGATNPAARHCCCSDCGNACCCVAADESPAPAPEAAPAASGLHDTFSVPAPAGLVWLLPDARAGEFSFSSLPALTAAGAPLYERHCALLI